MKKFILFASFILLLREICQAEVERIPNSPIVIIYVDSIPADGRTWKASAVASFPVGEFSGSHFAGIGLDIAWSKDRFGATRQTTKALGFIAILGVDYYFGRDVLTAGNTFGFGNYLYSHLMGGLHFVPFPKAQTTLAAGPTLGLYQGVVDPGIGVKLVGEYEIGRRLNLGPQLFFRKHSEAGALWTLGVQMSKSF